LAHLDGKITLGAYLMDRNEHIRFLVLDHDEKNGLVKLTTLAKELATENIPTYLEASRRGGHLWFFFATPITAELGRQFGKGLLLKHGLPSVELYPKQDKSPDGGPGSLIRMPFGRHLKSGQRYPFLDAYGQPIAPTVREQIRILAHAKTVPEDAIRSYADIEREKPKAVPYRPSGSATDVSWEKIKTRISAMDFISQYVDLRTSGNGAVGKCPFHDDQHNSFGVNNKGNYWHCFAGCGGGSVIDFWMKWRNLEFSQAVEELKDLLGVGKDE
jgi:hypothetical protein